MSAPDSDDTPAKVADEAPDSGVDEQAPDSSEVEAAAGDAAGDDKGSRQVAFAESDYRETKMTYDHGKVPAYVAAIWVVSLLGLIAYFVSYAIPDLQLWGSP